MGVSDFCRYPPAVLALPKVGTYTRPNAEKIASLRPDMVIIQKSTTTLADKLTALGIPYMEVKIGTLADVYSMIREIGIVASAADRAEKLNGQIRERLEAMRAETRGVRKPKVLIVVGRTPGTLMNLVAAGPSTYLGQLLEIAGGENALPHTVVAYPRISLETAVRSDPNVILDLSMLSDAEAQGDRLVQPWFSLPELQAVRNGRIFALSPEPLATPGPRIVESAELLRSAIRRQNHL